jgi:curli production assembly/transport component CsgF
MPCVIWEVIDMRLVIYFGLLTLLAQPAAAIELVYQPLNPSFGGNPNNGPLLMSVATAQNTFKAPVVPQSQSQSTQQSQLDQFTARLQSAILNQVSYSAAQSLFNSSGNLQLGASLEFNGFSVQVSPNVSSGNVSISVSDGITNTVLTVPYVGTTK